MPATRFALNAAVETKTVLGSGNRKRSSRPAARRADYGAFG